MTISRNMQKRINECYTNCIIYREYGNYELAADEAIHMCEWEERLKKLEGEKNE